MTKKPKTFEQSFASHNKAKYWSKKNILKPEQVFKNSGKKFLFDCECGHSFRSMLNNISKGVWCPYCANPSKKLCNNEDCKMCLNKTFISHPKAQYWSNKNKLKPNQVIKNTYKKYWFDCNVCQHSFEIVLSKVNSMNRWCCYCAHRKLCNNKDCKLCFNKSFASQSKAQYWSNKNKLKPNQVFKVSGKKYWFNCSNNHFFSIGLNQIRRGDWCNLCNMSSGESKIKNILNKMDINFKYQPKFKKCFYKKLLPFDFYIPKYNLIIEYDGIQHFQLIKYSNELDERDYRKIVVKDLRKNSFSISNGYSLLRISHLELNFIENILISMFNKINDKKNNQIIMFSNPKKYRNHYKTFFNF